MLRKIGIPVLALVAFLTFFAPAPAVAGVHWGVSVGPVYPHPYAGAYPYSYSPYVYPYPYSTYAYPYGGFYFGGHGHHPDLHWDRGYHGGHVFHDQGSGHGHGGKR
jgi:hypothetical protein